MNETDLIELIQTHLPQELTPEQIAEIRAKMADSPELQEALLEELSMEQGLAMQYAPPVADFEEVISRIEALAASRQRKHWLAWTTALICTLAIVTTAIILAVMADDEPPPQVASTSQPKSQPAAMLAGTSQTKPIGPLAAKPKPKVTPVVKKPVEPPVKPAVKPLPAGPSMTWRDYVLPQDDAEDHAWREKFEQLLRGRHGRKLQWVPHQKQYTLNGTYELTALPTDRQLIRLGVFRAEKAPLVLWAGLEGVAIDLQDRRQPLKGYTLRRRRKGDKAEVTEACDDGGSWRWYRNGTIDIRYQDGEILVCRGRIPLLRLPLGKPPTEGAFTDAQMSLYLAESRPARPLLPADLNRPAGQPRVAQAGTFQWTGREEDKIKPVRGADAAMTLSAKGLKDQPWAWFPLDVAPSPGMDVTVHLPRVSSGTCFHLFVAQRNYDIWINSHRGKTVLTESATDQGQRDRALRAGRVVGKELWCRVRFGQDFASIWASPDGKRWWPMLQWRDIQPWGQVRIGMKLAEGRSPRSITMGEVRIRRFGALAKLAPAALAARATKAASEAALKATTLAAALAAMGKAPDKKTTADRWQMACDAVLLSRSEQPLVRQAAGWQLLSTAAVDGGGKNADAVLAAARELIEITRQDKPELGTVIHGAFDALGRACLDADDTKTFARVLEASYLRPPLVSMPTNWPAPQVVPPRLLRMRLMDLINRDKWKSVRLDAARFLYMVQHLPTLREQSLAHSNDRGSVALAHWALARARAELGDDGEAGMEDLPTEWVHPLVVPSDKQMLNIMGEFLILVGDKNYASASRALIRQTLPNQLVPLGDEADLLRSSHFKIRQILRATPALRDVLRTQHAGVGMIRLKRARRQDDVQALKSLAAQFYGTEPGFEAMHALADRDLSHGSFYSAASRYQLLLAEEGYPRRRDAAAKFRFASAMLGQLVGEAVTEDVVFPGATFTAAQFEKMVRRLARERHASRVLGELSAALAGGPSRAAPRLQHLTDTPQRSDARGKSPTPSTRFAMDSRRLFVVHEGRLSAIDPQSRKRVWTYLPTQYSRRRSYVLPSRPLVVGKRLYLRADQKGRQVLACFDAEKGTLTWSGAYDDEVLSDPILIDSWLYVIAAKTAGGSAYELYLHRVSPETGESSLASGLLKVRGTIPVVGKPAVVGNNILLRASGCLVCCDFLGVVRWVRRLPFLPRDVDAAMLDQMPLEDMRVWKDRYVLFTSAGCPYVVCVDVATGKRAWSRMIHSPVRLVALVGGNLIFAEPDALVAVDASTGAARWRRRCETASADFLPAKGDRVVLVRIQQQTAKPKEGDPPGREILWLAAGDGKVVRQHRLEDTSLHGLAGLFTDGKRIFGLCNVNKDNGSAKVFVMELK